MLVSELIEVLEKQPKNAKIYIQYSEDGCERVATDEFKISYDEKYNCVDFDI